MHPLHELQKLLTPAAGSSSGTVVAVSGDKVSVSTRSGVAVLTRKDATDYRVGDRAIINGKELGGKNVDESNVPVFFI